MIYVEEIKVVGKTYPSSKVLKKNFKIKCSSVNLFVGNQGCGKSTMLNLLQQSHKDLEITLSDYVKKHGLKLMIYKNKNKHEI
jgi:ABC-type sugar transport system ATPase subunit